MATRINGRRQQLTTAVAYVITAAWSVSFVVDVIVDSYDPPPSLTPLMLIVAGYCFSDSIIPRRSGHSTPSEEPEQ